MVIKSHGALARRISIHWVMDHWSEHIHVGYVSNVPFHVPGDDRIVPRCFGGVGLPTIAVRRSIMDVGGCESDADDALGIVATGAIHGRQRP
jgi:hypothetical protein